MHLVLDLNIHKVVGGLNLTGALIVSYVLSRYTRTEVLCGSHGDGNTREAVCFDAEVGALREAVLEDCAEPGVSVAGDVDGCSCDEVVPASWISTFFDH